MQALEHIYSLFLKSSGVCTDTRKIQENCIFFALKGANFNGNEFAVKAIGLGAAYTIIDEKEAYVDSRTILVEDVLSCLQNLANYHRKQFTIPFLGITGSNGKTTSKELISSVLKTKYKTHFTQGNLNNHIGVPLTLLSMPLDTEIAVIEMGANHIGDIALLCKIAKPTLGIITNIGKAHLEGFGSLEGVAKGKSELFDSVESAGGNIFLNGMNDILLNMASRFTKPMIYSKTDEMAYCFGTLVGVNPFIKFSYKEEKNRQTKLIGAYNFENILSALAVAKYFGIPEKKAVNAICEYEPSNNRSQVLEKNGKTILLDAYNANPSSMRAAIENFSAIEHPKKITILGDMFELGSESNQEHLNIYELTISKHFEKSLFVGKYFKHVLIEQDLVFETKEELILYLKTQDLETSLLLIKGSRGIGLESIVENL